MCGAKIAPFGQILNSFLRTLLVIFMLGSVSGFFSPFFSAYAMSFSILLAMVILAIAERRRLKSRLKSGEKLRMPKYQKVILAIFGALAVGLILIGGLTKQ